ncbi:carboxymuconolactone decarboxylase family protein [Crenalkalicoccus roseus]|uniref:carboxymuconolactone decarboxylase family protein n=1 Tax=Crenalkalicoccus roseus TaxID=1485588 RepID=UPI001081CABF|nr:carboxymuconolactone decarboxylase family protein [Crenalkalicoccus roseus]
MTDSTTHAGPERLPAIPPERMSAEQRRVAEAITAGPRGSIRGPFAALLRSPPVADRVQSLGEYLRFHSVLPPALKELAILITARQWTAQFEWYAHHRLAMEAGLPPAIARAVAEGREPEGMDEDQRIVWTFCTELHRDRGVSDATYAKAVQRFGEQGVVELVAVSGYYVLVSMVLNVSRVPLPAGEEAPLRPLPAR